jgi:hypothetical protein
VLFLPSLKKPPKQVGTRPHRTGTKPGPKANVEGTVPCEGGPYWRLRHVIDGPGVVRFDQHDPRLRAEERGHGYVLHRRDDGSPVWRWVAL